MTPRRSTGSVSGSIGVSASVVVTVAACGLFTLLVSVTSLVEFAYREPALHVAVETAAALISLVAAQLLYGRFRQSYERRDLLLTAALGTFAASNLFFSALPAATGGRPSAFSTWAPVGGQLLGAVLLAAAALAPDRPLHHPGSEARRLLGGCALALVGLTAIVSLAGGALPLAIPPDLSPESLAHPRIVGNPTILGAELALMLLMAVTVAGFARRAARDRDELTRWLAIAATFGTFAQLNYFLFPSLYSEYFYAGDILRLCFLLALLVGGVLELRRTQQALGTAAVQDERQRLARDVHDGMAQDLAYIVQQGRRLMREPGAPTGLRALVVAAEHALDESRHVVATLARVGDEPLTEALSLTARETAAREGGRVEIRVEGEVIVPIATQEALLRVLREAMINARRHGDAETVVVELSEQPHLRLTVIDDGRGFDVRAWSTAPGHFGLKGMEARVRAIGGALTVESEPGHGTRVEVIVL